MREGMYTLSYQGPTGKGWGVLVFDTGIIWGVDVGGAMYDGSFQVNSKTDMIDAKFTLTVPAGTTLVTEMAGSNQVRKSEVRVSLPREFDKPVGGTVNFMGHPVQYVIQKARDAPINYGSSDYK